MRTVRRQALELNTGKAQVLRGLVAAFASEKRHWLDVFARRDHRHLICSHRKVRDAALAAKYISCGGLQARMWKLALIVAAQTWDKYWKSIFVEVRSLIGRRKDFDAADRHYAFWVLAGYDQFFAVLDGVAPAPKFTITEERRNKVASFLRRSVRKHRGKNPKVRIERSAVFDANCYTAFEEDGRQHIKLMGLKPGSRIVVPLLGRTAISGNIRLTLEDDGAAEIHVGFDLKPERQDTGPNVALDTGYTEAFVDTKGDSYGRGLGQLLTKASDSRNKTGKARNKLRAIAEKKAITDPAKARRIRRNNLGKIKWRQRERKARSSVNRIINTAINEVLEANPGALVITEDLRHAFTFNKGRVMNRRLSGWVRGALQDRIQFKALAEGFRHVQVNAAYSSQSCPKCGFVDKGNRKGDGFVCLHCGHEDRADRVGALNIERRVTDQEITRFTPYREVKDILLSRFRRRLEAKDALAASIATVPGRTPDIAPSAHPRPGIKTRVLSGKGSQVGSATPQRSLGERKK
jgi:putative transposase